MKNPEHFLFYSSAIDGERLRLDADEARHASRTLRLGPGASLRATDGAGTIYDCRLLHADRDGAECEILQTTAVERPRPRVELCIGLPDRDAFERLLEEVVALGVERIRPIVCEYCQKPWWQPRWAKYEQRFRRKMVVAMKQSLQASLPLLCEPVWFQEALSATAAPIAVADEHGSTLPSCLMESMDGHERIVGIVGPPGGFSPTELDQLTHQATWRVRLSSHRLRTELAATMLTGLLLTPHTVA